MRNINWTIWRVIAIISIAVSPDVAFAVDVPSAADVGRIDQNQKQTIPDNAPQADVMPSPLSPSVELPPGADQVKFVLQHVTIEGVKAFSPAELEVVYKPYIGKEISLVTVWKISDAITNFYQQKGYFLSRAIVPEQKIKNGEITFKVVEGYIADVEFESPLADKSVVQSLIHRLTSERPIKTQTLESVLLRLNDLPGISFRSVIAPLRDSSKEEGGVKLILSTMAKAGGGSLSFDNFNSPYFEKQQFSFGYATSIIPLQQTQFSAVMSKNRDRLKYFNLRHEIPLMDTLTAAFTGDYTTANPGYTLTRQNIEGHTRNFEFSLKNQIIKQRSENLSAEVKIGRKNSYTNTLKQPLTRDRIRVARASVSYDTDDEFYGYNYAGVTFSHGIDGLGASQPLQDFLSRARAKPNFRKLELNYTRYQAITQQWLAVAAFSAQFSTSYLYSSEQFGYGGQSFGRAYDPSDIIGDSGMDESLEVRYSGMEPFYNINYVPYVFYDTGRTWNRGATEITGSSTGFGLRAEYKSAFSLNCLLAQPLDTLPKANPYVNTKKLKPLIQLTYRF